MAQPLVLQARRRRGKLVVVANPIKRGYSRSTVEANIRELRRAGYPANQAVAVSLRSARASYRERYPRRAYPAHLKPPQRETWLVEHGRRKKTRRKKR